MKLWKVWSHVKVFACWEKYSIELPICNSVKKILNGTSVDKIMTNAF